VSTLREDGAFTTSAYLWYVVEKLWSLTWTYDVQASAIVYNALVIAETRLGLGLPHAIFPDVNVERYVLVRKCRYRSGGYRQLLTSVA
jgi:hypothetical protein